MKRKMGSLNLRSLFVHLVFSIPVLLWRTKLIVRRSFTLCHHKLILFFFGWNPLILFSPLGFMQLHLGCMIWERLDISKRKKWVALMCTMNKFWGGLLRIKVFKTLLSKLFMSLLSNINYFSRSKKGKYMVKKVVYSLTYISTVLQTENVFLYMGNFLLTML